MRMIRPRESVQLGRVSTRIIQFLEAAVNSCSKFSDFKNKQALSFACDSARKGQP
jgi:hypothetical protein